jgi:hypothetical protein
MLLTQDTGYAATIYSTIYFGFDSIAFGDAIKNKHEKCWPLSCSRYHYRRDIRIGDPSRAFRIGVVKNTSGSALSLGGRRAHVVSGVSYR